MTDSGDGLDTAINLELNAGPPLADPLLDSLYRRMRPMHSLYYQAVDTMKLAQVNHFEREGVLMDPADLTRVLVAEPYPPMIASTYSARCAGPEGIKVLDAFECWLYQHGLRHMGEIELARGLGGMTS